MMTRRTAEITSATSKMACMVRRVSAFIAYRVRSPPATSAKVYYEMEIGLSLHLLRGALTSYLHHFLPQISNRFAISRAQKSWGKRCKGGCEQLGTTPRQPGAAGESVFFWRRNLAAAPAGHEVDR